MPGCQLESSSAANVPARLRRDRMKRSRATRCSGSVGRDALPPLWPQRPRSARRMPVARVCESAGDACPSAGVASLSRSRVVAGCAVSRLAPTTRRRPETSRTGFPISTPSEEPTQGGPDCRPAAGASPPAASTRPIGTRSLSRKSVNPHRAGASPAGGRMPAVVPAASLREATSRPRLSGAIRGRTLTWCPRSG